MDFDWVGDAIGWLVGAFFIIPFVVVLGGIFLFFFGSFWYAVYKIITGLFP